MKKVLSILIVLTALVFVSGANAADTGFYIGAGGQHAWENFSNTDGIDVDNSFGINLRAGYQLMKYLAIEANYDWYNGFDLKWSGYDLGSIMVQTAMIDLKGMYPINDFVPYVRLGGGWMWAKFDGKNGYGNSSDNDFAWDFGAGIDYYINKNISIGPNIKYVIGTGNLDNIKYTAVGFGLEYHF